MMALDYSSSISRLLCSARKNEDDAFKRELAEDIAYNRSVILRQRRLCETLWPPDGVSKRP